MIGFPNETFSNIYDTVKVSLEMDLDWYQVSPLQPLPKPQFLTKCQVMDLFQNKILLK